jgi:tetratricopeptide (TPR) repeat protein
MDQRFSDILLSSDNETECPCPLESKAFEINLLGQKALIDQDLEKGLEFFNQALSLKQNHPKLYYEQGLSLFEFGTEEGKEKHLLLANKKFKSAVTLLPEYFDAWLSWGMTLTYLGGTYDEYHYFLEAKEKLEKALELSQGKSADVLSDLHWEYAIVRKEIATKSEEPHDWRLAIDSFESASSLSSITDPNFWNHFGLACLEMASQVNDVRLCVKAIHNFKHAISYEANSQDGWKNLSFAMQFLYECTHDEDHFSQANDCFATSASLYPLDDSLWLDWALFLCESGRRTQDTRRLHSAVEKCVKAYEINPDEPLILAYWGEALALIGELTDKIEYIHEGQNKLQEAIDLAPEEPLIWKSYGEILVCLGKYFHEYDYLYQAIEKFQEGLSLDRTRHELWFSIAKTYTSVGVLLVESDLLEKSIHFYQKAINLQPRSSYYHFEYANSLSKLGELSREEKWLEEAVKEFEQALQIQKNAIYLHPDWLFQYAKTLDLYAEFFEEESYYQKAIEIFSHVLMIDPDFPHIHYHLALVYSHLGELTGEIEPFYKALHYFKLASKHDEENDQVLVDLAVTLINIAQNSADSLEIEICYRDAELKLMQAIKAGNLQGYYQLTCLYSLTGQIEKSFNFLVKTESFNALPPMEDLLDDDWLDRLRSADCFKEFLHYLDRKSRQHEEL